MYIGASLHARWIREYVNMKALIALDDSTQTDRTLAAVGGWANTWGVEVHLLRVLKPEDIHETTGGRKFTHALTPAGTASGQPLYSAEPLPLIAETRAQAFTRVEMETEEALLASGKRYMPLASATPHVVVGDRVSEVIIDQASKLAVDLIVIGTHGRTGLSHVLMGSVAETVVRHSPIPVLVVGPQVGARS
jgi:nucleotide-binding universal stress UspA family protein